MFILVEGSKCRHETCSLPPLMSGHHPPLLDLNQKEIQYHSALEHVQTSAVDLPSSGHATYHLSVVCTFDFITYYTNV